MNKRYLGALILSPLVILIFIGGIYLKYFALLISLIGMYEFFNVVKTKNIHALRSIAYLACIVYYVLVNKNTDFHIIMLVILAAFFIMLCIPIIDTRYNFIDVAITLFALVYIGVFFSFLVLIDLKAEGRYLIWLVFVSSWLCDTTAYYTGRKFGKNKLCPKVSPNKTIEGSIGGMLGSTIACFILGIISTKFGVHIPVYHFIIIGILCGVFCQFGDLTASSIKRYINVKDYSNLIPGHGGILDRFDSILFAAFVVYYYIDLILKL